MQRYIKNEYVMEVHEKEQIPGFDIKLYYQGDFIGYSKWDNAMENFVKEQGYTKE